MWNPDLLTTHQFFQTIILYRLYENSVSKSTTPMQEISLYWNMKWEDVFKCVLCLFWRAVALLAGDQAVRFLGGIVGVRSGSYRSRRGQRRGGRRQRNADGHGRPLRVSHQQHQQFVVSADWTESGHFYGAPAAVSYLVSSCFLFFSGSWTDSEPAQRHASHHRSRWTRMNPNNVVNDVNARSIQEVAAKN